MDTNIKYSGIISGVKDGNLLIQHEDSKLPNRNYYVIGGPGSLKTQSFVLTNMVNIRDCSIVVTDPKGEVYEKTADIKRKQGYEVRVVNFKNMSASDGYNPFTYVRKNVDATTVANTIVSSKNDPKKKDIWFNAQLGLLKALILYVRSEFPPEKRNMEGILDFLQEFDPEENEEGVSELDNQFMKLAKRNPARRSYELGFKKSQKNTRGSIIISLLTTIGDFVDDEVSEFTKMNDFFFQDLGKKKMALYVLIPTMDSTWESLINLFFSQLFQELYLLGDNNGAKLPVPVVFLLDEFPNLGTFNKYEEFLATCRGYRIACCTILQNHSQMIDKYGKDKADSIIGNCAIKICLGNVNNSTATYFSENMGKATVKVDTEGNSVSRGKNGSSSSSQNMSYNQRSLMLVDEILRMDEMESIVIMGNKHPIKAKKAPQFKLFPGLLDRSNISQQNYKRKISHEAQAYYDKENDLYSGEMELEEDKDLINAQDSSEQEQEDEIRLAKEYINVFNELEENEGDSADGLD